MEKTDCNTSLEKIIELFENSNILQGKYDDGTYWSIQSILENICSLYFKPEDENSAYKSKYYQMLLLSS